MSALLTIAITDTCGCRRTFKADRATLDCGSGSLEFQAGCPAYCRKFDDAVVKISDAAGETVLVLHNGTASLTASELHILCEAIRDEPGGDPAGGTEKLSGRLAGDTENTLTKNKQKYTK